MQSVPREPLARIIDEWVTIHDREHAQETSNSAGYGDQAGALDTLSFMTGVPPRTLYRIRTGNAGKSRRTGQPLQNTTITLDLADRILTGLGRNDLWHELDA